MVMLTQLADVARRAGLTVVELDGWKTRTRPMSLGGFDPVGILWHHTGSFDSLTDAQNDRDYAKWLAVTGRSDLPAPLCQISISAEGTVYICAAGRANHAGEARSSGTVAAGDGNRLYIGVECMNSGKQGWPKPQYAAMVTLGAALTNMLGNSVNVNRAHKETSTTGKWDPGMLDMDKFRRDIAAAMNDDEAPTPKPDPEPAPRPTEPRVGRIPAWRVRVAAQEGIQNADAAARAATRAGLPYWAACALLEKESHGRNVFGHDVGGAGWPGQRVTRARFEEFYAKVLDGATSNGVGPAQITWAGSLVNGKRDGGFFREMLAQGLKPWDIEDNMFFGFTLIRDYYTAADDSWRAAGTRYNGRESYGADFLEKIRDWRELLDIKAPFNPRLPAPKPDAPDEPDPEPTKPAKWHPYDGFHWNPGERVGGAQSTVASIVDLMEGKHSRGPLAYGHVLEMGGSTGRAVVAGLRKAGYIVSVGPDVPHGKKEMFVYDPAQVDADDSHEAPKVANAIEKGRRHGVKGTRRMPPRFLHTDTVTHQKSGRTVTHRTTHVWPSVSLQAEEVSALMRNVAGILAGTEGAVVFSADFNFQPDAPFNGPLKGIPYVSSVDKFGRKPTFKTRCIDWFLARVQPWFRLKAQHVVDMPGTERGKGHEHMAVILEADLQATS